MKKLIAAILAILCLAGCGNAKNQLEAATTTVTKTPAPVEEAPAEEPSAQQPPMQEVEIEVECEFPAEPENKTETEPEAAKQPDIIMVEGLVGDAVGYALELPVFDSFYDHADTMNQFYEALVEGLEKYANGAVNQACLERNCIASVYGKVASVTQEGDVTSVTYDCVVEYSDTKEQVVNTRVDHWNNLTGEVTSEVG